MCIDIFVGFIIILTTRVFGAYVGLLVGDEANYEEEPYEGCEQQEFDISTHSLEWCLKGVSGGGGDM